MEQVLRDMNDQSRLSYVGPAGEVREVMLATHDTPEALKVAWTEELERRRVLQERASASVPQQPRGLFASIRKVFGGE